MFDRIGRDGLQILSKLSNLYFNHLLTLVFTCMTVSPSSGFSGSFSGASIAAVVMGTLLLSRVMLVTAADEVPPACGKMTLFSTRKLDMISVSPYMASRVRSFSTMFPRAFFLLSRPSNCRLVGAIAADQRIVSG